MTTGNVRTYTTSVNYIVGAWALLMALTFLAWWLGGEHGVATLGVKAVDAVILVLAFGKMAVVSHVFMEQRLATRWLHASFTGWYLVVGGGLLALYLS
jgi:Prokaryotic Cytochrome C oxidase subunit IV